MCIRDRYVIDEWKFKAATLDIHTIRWDRFDYVTHKSDGTELKLLDSANSVINTSCEHITQDKYKKWLAKVPDSAQVIVQSNDYYELEEHVNCCKNLEQFARRSLLEVDIKDEIELPKYKRFMVIGKKK